MTKKGWGILLGITGVVLVSGAGYYFIVVVPKNKTAAEAAKAKAAALAAGKTANNSSATAPTATIRAGGTKAKTPPPATPPNDSPPVDTTVDTEIGDTVWAAEKVPLYISNQLITNENGSYPNLGPSNIAKYIANGDKIGIAGDFDGNFLTVYRDESWFGGEASTYYVYTDSLTAV